MNIEELKNKIIEFIDNDIEGNIRGMGHVISVGNLPSAEKEIELLSELAKRAVKASEDEKEVYYSVFNYGMLMGLILSKWAVASTGNFPGALVIKNIINSMLTPGVDDDD